MKNLSFPGMGRKAVITPLNSGTKIIPACRGLVKETRGNISEKPANIYGNIFRKSSMVISTWRGFAPSAWAMMFRRDISSMSRPARA